MLWILMFIKDDEIKIGVGIGVGGPASDVNEMTYVQLSIHDYFWCYAENEMRNGMVYVKHIFGIMVIKWFE